MIGTLCRNLLKRKMENSCGGNILFTNSKLEKWCIDESKMKGNAFQIQMASSNMKFHMERGAHPKIATGKLRG
jgi:hypothetical protein